MSLTYAEVLAELLDVDALLLSALACRPAGAIKHRAEPARAKVADLCRRLTQASAAAARQGVREEVSRWRRCASLRNRQAQWGAGTSSRINT